MKKAKEYAEYILEVFRDPLNPNNNQEGFKALIGLVISDIGFNETQELLKKRHISTDAGFIAILKEQCNKYNAFVRLVNAGMHGNFLLNDGLKNYYLEHSELKQYAEKI